MDCKKSKTTQRESDKGETVFDTISSYFLL